MDNIATGNSWLDTDINPTGRLALQLLQALQQTMNKESAELVLDLAALCRTLVVLSRRLKYGYIFNTSDVQILKNQLQVMRSMFVLEGQSAVQLELRIAATSLAINQAIAVTKYIFALPANHVYHPWGDIVQSTSEATRYDLKSKCVLETDLELTNRVSAERAQWVAIQSLERSVYEHVGRLDGGESMYDPFFLSRSPFQAHDFFTPGRVFTMLWSTDGCEVISGGIAHYDYGIEAYRYDYSEGVFTGPFEGPTTARYFLVVRGGRFSMLCLSIVTLPYLDPDAQRYVRITMNTQQSQHPEGVQIQFIPKPYWEPGPKRVLEPFQSYSIPSSDLPLPCSKKDASDFMDDLTGQRGSFAPVMSESKKQRIKNLTDRKFYIDLKRIVEVESGVKVKNVGIINDSMIWTQIKAMFSALSN